MIRRLLLLSLLSSASLHALDERDIPDHRAIAPDASSAAAFTAIYYSSGIEVLAYPTGLQPTLQIMPFKFENSELQVFLGMNLADHRDQGVHQRESGYGFGAGIGSKWWPFGRHDHFFTGLRGEMWRMTLHWEDPRFAQSGDSLVTVWQPSFLLGWRFPWKGSLYTDLIASIGQEFNVDTVGAPTGQGPIVRAGISLGWR